MILVAGSRSAQAGSCRNDKTVARNLIAIKEEALSHLEFHRRKMGEVADAGPIR